MLFFIVRHGQTDWNVEDRFQGRSDIPLNEAGERQAREVGRELVGLGIQKVVTSPLLRAQTTGKLIAELAGIPIQSIDERLTERDLGSYEGLTIASCPDYFRILNAADGSMEPLAEVGRRMREALLSIRGMGFVAIVSHGAAINALLYDVSAGKAGTGVTKLDNGCVCVLHNDGAGGELMLLAYNLPPAQLHRWIQTNGRADLT